MHLVLRSVVAYLINARGVHLPCPMQLLEKTVEGARTVLYSYCTRVFTLSVLYSGIYKSANALLPQFERYGRILGSQKVHANTHTHTQLGPFNALRRNFIFFWPIWRNRLQISAGKKKWHNIRLSYFFTRLEGGLRNKNIIDH